MAGRFLNTAARDFIVERVEAAGEQGITAFRLAHEMHLAGLDYSRENVNILCWELAGKGRDRGYGRRIHCARYESRRDVYGRRYGNGKLAPVFVFGEGENVPHPPLSKSAIKQRESRAAERAIEMAHRDKVEKARRLALKRKPALDALICALFGRPLPK